MDHVDRIIKSIMYRMSKDKDYEGQIARMADLSTIGFFDAIRMTITGKSKKALRLIGAAVVVNRWRRSNAKRKPNEQGKTQ